MSEKRQRQLWRISQQRSNRSVPDRDYNMEKWDIRCSGHREELWANKRIVRRYLAV